MKMRLNKVVSLFGGHPRRKADDLILNGKVTVDSEVCTRPFQRISLHSAKVSVLGKDIPLKASSKVYALNKPTGFLCSHRRLKPAELLVYDLFKTKDRLFTAGRLDKESQGLIIITNDGDLAYKLTHPSHEVEKEYMVKTSRAIKPQDIKTMFEGVKIDGIIVKPKKVVKLRARTLRFVLTDGKKHEVRLLCKKAGLGVIQLKRIRIGSLALGKLPIGHFRQLSSKDTQKLIS